METKSYNFPPCIQAVMDSCPDDAMSEQINTECGRITVFRKDDGSLMVGRIIEATAKQIKVEHVTKKSFRALTFSLTRKGWTMRSRGLHLVPMSIDRLKNAFLSYWMHGKGLADDEMDAIHEELKFLNERSNTNSTLAS